MVAAVPAEALETIRAAAGPGAELVRVPEPGADLEQALAAASFLVVDLGRDDVIAVLARLEHLEVVQVFLAGTDWIAPAIPAGVALCDARGTRDDPVAEWIAAVLLGFYTGVLAAVRDQHREHWEHFRRDELAGRRVLIVGMGSIGRATRARLERLGVDVVGVARRTREDTEPLERLPELLPEADAVVLLTPLTPDTEGFVDAAFLDRMRDGALLVNAARGGVVDTDALVAELERGRLRAVLDVVDPEPLPPGHPLWRAPGAWITPRIGGDSPQGAQRAWWFAGEQLGRFARGEPLENVAVSAG